MQIENKNSLSKKELFQLSKHVVLKKALLARNKMPLASRKYFDEYGYAGLHTKSQKPKKLKQRARIEIKKDATIGILIFITLATTMLLSWIV
jgi:hypothetical protein